MEENSSTNSMEAIQTEDDCSNPIHHTGETIEDTQMMNDSTEEQNSELVIAEDYAQSCGMPLSNKRKHGTSNLEPSSLAASHNLQEHTMPKKFKDNLDTSELGDSDVLEFEDFHDLINSQPSISVTIEGDERTVRMNPQSKTVMEACNECGTSMQKTSNMNVKHATPAKQTKHKNMICPVSEGAVTYTGADDQVVTCKEAFSSMAELRSHITQTHQQILLEEIHSFQTFTEFESWLSKEEQEQKFKFIKIAGVKEIRCKGKKLYYGCHRSGKFTPQGKGVRKQKSQGTCKIGATCPAGLEVTMGVSPGETGYVSAHYHKTHLGHEMNMEHVRLSREDRQMVADELNKGLSIDAVLDTVTQQAESPMLRSLKKHDLYNIARDFNIKTNKNKQHKTNLSEIAAWVTTRASGNQDDTVKLLKFPGEAHETLSSSDFVLVIMTSVQEEMLIKFGTDKIICIDSTPRTNLFSFQLTTLLVTDNYSEGFPVAFCFSNNSDVSVLEVFLERIKSSTGVISNVTLMTDDASIHVPAWEHVMGLPQYVVQRTN